MNMVLSKSVSAFSLIFAIFFSNENFTIDFEDEIVNGSMLLNKGEVNHPMLQKFMEEKS